MGSNVVSPVLDAVKDARDVMWIGKYSPQLQFASTCDPIDGTKGFRCPSHLHQSFNTVIMTEFDLGTIKQWKIVLDEALRLLRPQGTIVLRYGESAFLTVCALKNFLLTWSKHQVAIIEEAVSTEHMITTTIRLTTTEPRNANATSWTFGLITDGKRLSNVVAFVESVRAIRGLKDFEIVICGPRIEIGNFEYVRFIEPAIGFEKMGWITQKKNQIVAAARHPNLVVAHDRYTIDADFLENVSSFGGDFDVLTPAQKTLSGDQFPDWVTTAAPWNVAAVGKMNYDDYSPFSYINGGFIISKTKILLEIGWNNLLFWNQAEDVELSRRLEAAGWVHRMAKDIRVRTLDVRANYLEHFKLLPEVEGKFVLPGSVFYSPYVFVNDLPSVFRSNLEKGIKLVIFGTLSKLGLKKTLKVLFVRSKPRLVQALQHTRKNSPWLAQRIETIGRLVQRELRR